MRILDANDSHFARNRLNAFQSRRHGLKQAVINTRSRKLRQEPLQSGTGYWLPTQSHRPTITALVAAVSTTTQKEESLPHQTVLEEQRSCRTGEQF